MLKVWSYAVFIVAWTAWLLGSNYTPLLKIIGIAAGMLLPHVLRWFAMKSAGAA